MTISADMIKTLRQSSGAGIMECKEALKETDGDMDAALEFLRKKGSSKAAKKADRSTKEGAVGGVADGSVGAIVEVKCETDFVARNDKFQELTKSLAGHVAKSPEAADDEAFLAQAWADDPSKTVNDVITASIHELGENIVVGRREKVTLDGDGGFGLYIHGVGGLGALVEVACGSAEVAGTEKFSELCRDLAMHVVASHPLSVSVNDLPQEVVAKEREIFEAQTRESGKPENIIPKIVEGRLKKYYTEACLLEQPFVKDPDRSVKKLLEDAGKEIGSTVEVKRFVRYQLGE